MVDEDEKARMRGDLGPVLIVRSVSGRVEKPILRYKRTEIPLSFVRSVTLDADLGEYPTITMFVPDLDAELPVTEMMASAIICTDSRRQLSFLTDADAKGIRDLREEIRNNWEVGRADVDRLMVGLDKIIAELDRRDEIPW